MGRSFLRGTKRSVAAVLAYSAFMFSSPVPGAVVTGDSFSTGFNTGYSVTVPSTFELIQDFFVFDSDGVATTSFYFDRTSLDPDLALVLYSGDVRGFDYVAAGANDGVSFTTLHPYNPAIAIHSQFDDSHPCVPVGCSNFGDPDFSLVLTAGRYSVQLSSYSGSGTYEFTTSASMAPTVPLPAAVWLFGSALGILGWMRRKSA
jgi:hypothetical protein